MPEILAQVALPGYAALVATIGALFLGGLALDTLGRRVHVPRVSLLILLGVATGPAGLGLLPPPLAGADGPYADVALTMIAFLLGGGLTRSLLRDEGIRLMAISAVVVAAAVLIVGGGLWLAGVPAALALAFGGLAGATDPAATADVVREAGVHGPFSRRLLGIVAVDDAWGLIAFSMVMAAASLLTGMPAVEALALGAWEVLGALALGVAVGLPAARLTGRLKPGEPTLVEALGVVFLTAGFAMALEVSFLLAGMACGVTIANRARHHERPFHEIERIEWPFMLLFFVMAGASLELDALAAAGALGAGYVALRTAGRLVGGVAAGLAVGLGARTGALTGLALMPQAGVAIGMALVAAERLPHQAEALLAVAVASTVLFEVAGPFATQAALARADARQGDGASRP
ncbi:cation:proton antiporter [Rhodovulum sp. 12E13]|uniref:cation:proton antiporter n=1 Tax=Rhodovulum sp. 12E13 TaxID=2203891 RepID=UPI000E1A3AEF|nr:cation:proton antiporter [Rhodovulum sp. 12E13]RDC72383.1 cation:proton antiporter [Rhodovulum sp. 12E13]